ncbi:FeoA family protein [Anaeromyxobacter oryzisoli]|uniref:FeoA family protein n=1 Tax=Anaeromyxobacter oryzisoli TaxID=2925408 RepID=UPI001F5A7E97|nr:FeoA family protein [Anaeromyxobacter sp. SG63]
MAMLPLGLLGDGEVGEIVAVAGADQKTGAARAEDMGLRIGKRVLMLNNGAGPLLVKVDESRIAIDRGVAMKIKVRTA